MGVGVGGWSLFLQALINSTIWTATHVRFGNIVRFGRMKQFWTHSSIASHQQIEYLLQCITPTEEELDWISEHTSKRDRKVTQIEPNAFVYLFVCLSIHPSIHLSILHPSIHPSIRSFIHSFDIAATSACIHWVAGYLRAPYADYDHVFGNAIRHSPSHFRQFKGRD